MGDDRDDPQIKAEHPAANATQNESTLSGEEAQTTPSELDSALNGLHETQKNDRPNDQVPVIEDGFTTREDPGVSGDRVDGKYAISAPGSRS